MPRRSSFQWNPANIVILVVVAILVALGAAYWAQVSQQIGSGLGAFVGGAGDIPEITAKPSAGDPRCLSDTTKESVKIGSLKFTDTGIATTEMAAKQSAYKNLEKYIKSIDCNKDHASTVKGGRDTPISVPGGGKVSSTTGLKVPVDLKAVLGCNRNKEAKNQCATMCQKQGTQCTIAHQAGHCTITATETTPPRGVKVPKGKKYFKLEADCDVYANVAAQCSCAKPSECYAFRGYGETGPGEDNQYTPGDDGVGCVCPSEDKAKKDCPTLMALLCVKGEKLTTDESISKVKDKWTMSGKCAKETSIEVPPEEEEPTPTPTVTMTPITGTPTPTPTVIMTPITFTPTATPTTTPPLTI